MTRETVVRCCGSLGGFICTTFSDSPSSEPQKAGSDKRTDNNEIKCPSTDRKATDADSANRNKDRIANRDSRKVTTDAEPDCCCCKHAAQNKTKRPNHGVHRYFGFAVHVRRAPSGLTTQAQRPGARDATMATATLPPGSLQRMVRRLCSHVVSDDDVGLEASIR